MNFVEYKEFFISKAESHGFSQMYIDAALNYAETIYSHNCPVIYDLKHFSLLVGFKEGYIKRAITYPKGYYWSFCVKKKNGGVREIDEPLPNLKEIQKWILSNILYSQPSHKFAKAYIPHKRLKENARFHTNMQLVITLDIKDFFSSISRQSIENLFLSFGYSWSLSNLFSKLVCLNGSLPQGAPTSPYLSNLYMYDFDEELMHFCIENHIIYTRYADDLSFSTKNKDLDVSKLIETVKELLRKKGLVLNEKKTKIMGRNQRQTITGIVVNQRVHADKDLKRQLRQELHYIRHFGFENHIAHKGVKKNNYDRYLLGRVNFVLGLEPQNREFINYKLFLQKLINPKFQRNLRRLKIYDTIYKEQRVEQLSREWKEYIMSKSEPAINFNGIEMSYQKSFPQINSLLFGDDIRKLDPTIDCVVIEGIVIDEDGNAFCHFWNQFSHARDKKVLDITYGCFSTIYESSIDRSYFKTHELTLGELRERILAGGDPYSEQTKQLLSDYRLSLLAEKR